MSNPELLNTEILFVNKEVIINNYGRIGQSGPKCGQKFIVNGNISVTGSIVLCGNIRTDNITEKTPGNGIDINGLGKMSWKKMPTQNYNSSDCTTYWGYNAMINVAPGDGYRSSAFGYNCGALDAYPESQTLFGKNIFVGGYSGNRNCSYFGAEIASQNIDDNHYDSTVIGAFACNAHDYNDAGFIIGYRNYASNPFDYSDSFEVSSVGSRALEYAYYNYEVVAMGAQSKQYSMYDFSSTACGFRTQNILGTDFEGNFCSHFGAFAAENLYYSLFSEAFGAYTFNITNESYNDFAFGYKAGSTLYTSRENTLIGHNVLASPTLFKQCQHSVIVGNNAMFNYNYNTPYYSSNTCVGNNSLYNITELENTTVLGNNVLYNLTIDNGSYTENTVIGHNVLELLEYGSYNTVIGIDAMRNANNGDNNTIIGRGAASVTNSLNKCTLIGYIAGNSPAIGDDCILIGSESAHTGPTTTKTIGIGYKTVSDSNCIAVGGNASCTGTNSIVIGTDASDAGFGNCVCLGTGATATGTDQIVFPNGFTLSNTASNPATNPPPAQVAGYITLVIDGVSKKIPVYPLP